MPAGAAEQWPTPENLLARLVDGFNIAAEDRGRLGAEEAVARDSRCIGVRGRFGENLVENLRPAKTDAD